MKDFDRQIQMPRICRILRLITVFFAVSGSIAMICAAVWITLCSGDWWFNLFAVNLAAILMIAGTLYLSLLTLLTEITRYFRNKITSDCSDTPVTKWLHRLLMSVSLTGIASFLPFFLIFCDILHGNFAVFHFICGGAIAVLYFALGIYAVIHRKKTRSEG